MLLAQTTPNADSFLQFWLAVGLILSVAANVFAIWRGGSAQRREIGPQPFEIKAAAEYATKEELARLEKHFVDFRSEILSALKEREIERSKNLARLHERIDEMPERILRMLKETKHLIP
jgi:hypothetical protein